MMTKKHFISLADTIREWKVGCGQWVQPQDYYTLLTNLAGWCRQQNPSFNEARWRAYIAGECGPNGGPVKEKQS
jgi:hypothetical protein